MLLKMAIASVNEDTLDSERLVNIVASINRTGTSAMTEICNRFKSVAPKYDIVSMYETQPVNGGSLVRSLSIMSHESLSCADIVQTDYSESERGIGNSKRSSTRAP